MPCLFFRDVVKCCDACDCSALLSFTRYLCFHEVLLCILRWFWWRQLGNHWRTWTAWRVSTAKNLSAFALVNRKRLGLSIQAQTWIQVSQPLWHQLGRGVLFKLSTLDISFLHLSATEMRHGVKCASSRTHDLKLKTWQSWAKEFVELDFRTSWHPFSIPHIFVWGSCFLLCAPVRLRPPSTRLHGPLFVIHNFVTHNFVTHNSFTHLSFTQHCQRMSNTTLSQATLPHITLSHTHNFVTHTQNSFRDTHTHTTLSHTHTTLPHAPLSHTHTRNFVTHTQPSHTPLFHTQLCHTETTLYTIDGAFGWQAWHLRHWAGSGGALGRPWSAVPPRSFAWQASRLVTLTLLSCGMRDTYGIVLALVASLVARGRLWRRGLLRGRCAIWWHALAGVALTALGWLLVARCSLVVGCDAAVLRGRHGAWWHRRLLCVAGVALGDMHANFVGQLWLRTLDWFLCVLGRSWSAVTPRSCVAGVAFGDMYAHFVWQAGRLVTSTTLGAFGCPWSAVTPQSFAHGRLRSTLTLCGRRGIWRHVHLFAWQVWHLVTLMVLLCGRRGICLHWRACCLAGVAVGDRHRAFVWQAWTRNSFTHNSFTRNFVTHNSFTRNVVTHNFSIQTHSRNSFTRRSVTPNSVTHDFVTRHSFTHNSVTHNSFSHNPVTHNSFAHSPFTHNPFTHTTLSHATLSHAALSHTCSELSLRILLWNAYYVQKY